MSGTDKDYRMNYVNPMYRVWNSMNQRCRNPKDKSYKWYGGRGLTITGEWLGRGGFRRFVDDMHPRPSGTSIDRTNNDKGYSKKNCRWITHKEQCNNRSSNNKVIDPATEKLYTLTELADAFGVNERTVRSRFLRGHTKFDQLTYKGHLAKYNRKVNI